MNLSLNDLFAKLLGLPELASKHGAEVDKLILYVHYLMAALFAGLPTSCIASSVSANAAIRLPIIMACAATCPPGWKWA
jgi:hypothetical protein